MLHNLLLVSAILCTLQVCVAILLRKYRSPLPPGPFAVPFCKRAIPEYFPFLQFEEWVKEYGPVFALRNGSSVVVVVGRYQAAMEVLEKCGAQTADRPRSIIGFQVFSKGLRPLLMSNTPIWKVMNRAQRSHLLASAAKEYEPIQLRAANKLVLSVLSDSDEYLTHIRMFALQVILRISHGKVNPSFNDPDVQAIIRSGVRIGNVFRPGAYLVDTIPLLRYVPGYLTEVQRWSEEEWSLFQSMLDYVRERLRNGEQIHCFAQKLIDNEKSLGLSEGQLMYLAGTMFGAGFETTASSLTFTIMAAATFPEAVKRVQQELDAVVGKERCPTFDDKDDLVQVTAFVLERSRWRPIFGAGVPHAASEDILYQGYIIPKGATVIGSNWSIFRDPDIFPNPDVFDPQRWIASSHDGKEIIRKDLRDFTFGFGRRACPGLHVANRSMFIATAMLLWAFHVLPDPEHPIDTMAFSNTLNIRADPFKVVFKPRVENLKDFLSRA